MDFNLRSTSPRNAAGQIATRTSSNDLYSWNGHVNVDRSYTTNGLNQYSAAGSASFTYDANACPGRLHWQAAEGAI